MSFGGGGFGTGFGSTNNNNQSSGFGGFGGSATQGGFGQQQTTGFGANANTNTNPIFGGGGTATGGGTGFGSTASGFGGASKPFGGTTGGSLFGNNASTSTAGGTGFGGGGFGSNTNTGSAFGGASSGNTMFGSANKPAFGAGSSTGGTLFGSSGTQGGGFGAATANTGALFGGGAQVTGECQGTGSTPFQAYTEKEPSSAVTNHYQSITFMAPYQKFSFEELRLADYNAGRRFGNGSGQAGAFGASTGFGGFGQNNQTTTSGFGSNTSGAGGLFGQQASSTGGGGFGSTTQTTGGFGSGGGGGLFGQQNKPAGGLFGSTAASSASTGGSLFATSGGTGFGSAQQSTGFGTGTGSSLFGSNQNQMNQQKPGFSFGQNNTSGAGGAGGGFGGFGGSTGATAGGSLFGNNQNQNQPQNQGSSIFGNNQQQGTGGLFGQQNQNQNQNQGSGFGAFGQNNQQKPGGLFGSGNSTASGGLFGSNQNAQQQPSGTNLFGQTASSGGGLFGPKPAQTGSNLFGQNSTNTAGGGLFGSTGQNQPQQNSGGGLFGNSNNSGGSNLFGQRPAQTGTSVFGNNQQQTQGTNLFGSQNNQAQNPGFSYGSLNGGANNFGAQQNSLQGPPALTASAQDANPYGSASIFSGLPQPSQTNPGPIATPISAGQKQKKPAALPQFKINPSMSSRFATPQRRGYGFTYSTYGTPSSASSVASSPGGLSSSLIASSLGRSLGKSFSASNLRRTFDTDGESILSPGAFSANSNRYGTGSLKKLNIDRSLRTDLFGAHAVAALPAPERQETSRSPAIKKKVSFDTSTFGGTGSGSATSGGLEERRSSPNAHEQGFVRSRSSNGHNGRAAHTGTGSPTKDPNSELTTVHEDGSPQASKSNALVVRDQGDPELGEYWTQPRLAELRSLPRDKLKAVTDFQVGRDNGGQVTFQVPVDLTTVDLDSICGKIVVIELRSLTVYPTTVDKPPVGQGLNVPSLIKLENSWPRQRDKKTPLFETSGPRFEKHVKRLSMVSDTEFVGYEAKTGEWTFRVPHFTTYGLDYDDETTEQSDMDTFDAGLLSEAQSVATPTPTLKQMRIRSSPKSQPTSSSMAREASHDSSEPDDTFDFKKKPLPPGAFDTKLLSDIDMEMDDHSHNEESFLEERSAALDSDEDDQDEPSEPQETMTEEHMLTLHRDAAEDNVANLIGSFPTGDDLNQDPFDKSFRASAGSLGIHRRTLVDEEMDWIEQLQQTISPRKQDRQALRQSQVVFLKDQPFEFHLTKPPKEAREGKEIITSIDLMDSLFGKEEARRTQHTNAHNENSKSFKWPYPKSSLPNLPTQSDSDRDFHASFKPSWSWNHRLTYVTHDRPDTPSRDICTMKFEKARDITAAKFRQQFEQSRFVVEQGVPRAYAHITNFASNKARIGIVPAHAYESLIWELLSVLFDDQTDEIPPTVPLQAQPAFNERLRKDRLSTFWAKICEDEAMKAVAAAHSAEERAIAYLSAHRIPEACAALVDGKDYRLATLIAQIGEDQNMRDDMEAQIEEWRKLNVLSEMSEPIRALYELLAGNTCKSVGKRGPVEDRAQDFLIPERFDMDWKRAFGLKLWYGTFDNEPLEDAIRDYAADLRNTDIRKPVPPFLANKDVPMPWKDRNETVRQDVFWGLLDLYSLRSSPAESATDLAQVVMPENTVGLPMFHRLSFELYRSLTPKFPEHATVSLGDMLAIAFAAELEGVDQWLWAVFVLLHISDSRSRRMALQSALARNAAVLHYGEKSVWETLVNDFKIPEHWLWEAMALYARSDPSISSEKALQYLLKANAVEEAHRMLLETVAPLKIVERDYSGLQSFISEFHTSKPKAWEAGGGLYSDFINLLQGNLGKNEKRSLIAKLVRGLADSDGAMVAAQDDAANANFLQRVAVREMSQVVGELLLENVGGDTKDQVSILQLPLNPETKAFRARDLSWSYYRKIMAAHSS